MQGCRIFTSLETRSYTMKISTLLPGCLLLISLLSFSTISRADNGKNTSKSGQKTWTRWELSPSADIYYRTEISTESPDGTQSDVVAVEFLNSYKKEISFCFAINDTGNPTEVKYQPVFKLKKNKSAVVFYPRPKDNTALIVTISGLEVAKN